MKYFVFCYRVPVSFERFRIGSQFMFIQSVKSYNNTSGSQIYELVTSKITPTEQYTFSRIHPNLYPSFLVKKFLPKGCETSEETSTSTWPVTRTVYVTPNRPQIGTAELMTSVHPEKLDGIPAYFEQFINGNKYHLEYFDLGGKNEEACYVYKLAKFEVNMFGKTILEKVSVITIKSIFKASLTNLIQTRSQWENLTDNDLTAIYNGDIVTAVKINIEDNQDVEQDVE
ncbi:Phosphatidylinositol_transfer protein [Hexamita inflata]|uniref:Phosphatidylinositol transfer protein n=1 Tax=Hexamita inflata TaxID=28002 RepID=A0AA86QLQ8_9EUKA|nr:Phosphatidylinositol transfer protein [Hexamita inflata]CAI9956147.1 Phosphatidylinositol transfer protein [Hexamita inflata]